MTLKKNDWEYEYFHLCPLQRDEYLKIVSDRIHSTLKATYARFRRMGIPVQRKKITEEDLWQLVFWQPGIPLSLDQQLDHLFPCFAWLWLYQVICRQYNLQLTLTEAQIDCCISNHILVWISAAENKSKQGRYDKRAFVAWLKGFPGVFSKKVLEILMFEALNSDD